MKMDFYDNWDLEGFQPEVAGKINKYIMEAYRPQITLEGQDWTKSEVIERNLLQDGQNSGSTPWFAKWKEFFLEQCRFQMHEMTDHPFCFFYLLSSSAKNVIDDYKQLVNMPLPEQYTDKNYLRDVPKVFFLIHEENGQVSNERTA